MKGKYITVLDFEIGRVFQYENLKHFIDGWNGNDEQAHTLVSTTTVLEIGAVT